MVEAATAQISQSQAAVMPPVVADSAPEAVGMGRADVLSTLAPHFANNKSPQDVAELRGALSSFKEALEALPADRIAAEKMEAESRKLASEIKERASRTLARLQSMMGKTESPEAQQALENAIDACHDCLSIGTHATPHEFSKIDKALATMEHHEQKAHHAHQKEGHHRPHILCHWGHKPEVVAAVEREPCHEQTVHQCH